VASVAGIVRRSNVVRKKSAVQEELAEEVELWNREDASDLVRPRDMAAYRIVVAARDWTVETIVQQIKEGNVELDPAFQRRNAWRDHRRSRLIESFILGFPVPQIVLAENPNRRKSFIVIDGRQRLMTIAGLYLPEYRSYWNDPSLSGLKVLDQLNGVGLDQFLSSKAYAEERRELANADIRTTVVTGFKDEAVLYDIFYRINTGTVPLSSQELRQVLNRGAFARYLLDTTSVENPIWTALKINSPDPRLRDVELMLRLVAWQRFPERYRGNMKLFLDDTMKDLNNTWAQERGRVAKDMLQLFAAVEAAAKLFGEHLGRKYKDGRFEPSFNRAVFEVQVQFLVKSDIRTASFKQKSEVVSAFKKLSAQTRFLAAIEATTKSMENTRSRFELYRQMLQRVLGKRIPSSRIGGVED